MTEDEDKGAPNGTAPSAYGPTATSILCISCKYVFKSSPYEAVKVMYKSASETRTSNTEMRGLKNNQTGSLTLFNLYYLFSSIFFSKSTED